MKRQPRRHTVQLLRSVALFWVFASGPQVLLAQPEGEGRTRTVEIIRADSSVSLIESGERVRKLLGNVHLLQEETRLQARTVTQYVDREAYLLAGDVSIMQTTDTLLADQVLYNSRTRTGVATGDVRLSDGEAVLYAPSGTYFLREKRAQFAEGVRLVDSVTVLTSHAGAYWLDEKRAEFYDDVALEQARTFLKADSITHFRETEVSVARGNVSMRQFGGEDDAPDSTQVSFLLGERVHYDNRSGDSRVEGSPLLLRVKHDEETSDTLIVRAGLFEGFKQDSLERLIALDSVRIWQDDFAAVADSLVYDRFRPVESEASREEIRLFNGPVGWFDASQISGDSLFVFATEGNVDSLGVRGTAFVARWDSTLSRVQQLEGASLDGYFEEGRLVFLTVGPNASAIHFLSDEEEALDGAVQLSGDRISFTFDEEELRSVEASPGVEGAYYVVDLIPEAFQLSGYRWEPERRPDRRLLLEPSEIQRMLAELSNRTMNHEP